jgi:LysR family glycine cleavage system transcriptional activator
MVPSNRVVDLRREQIDLAIRYGTGHWPGLVAVHLFNEQASPVARPGYMAEGADVGEALKGRRLIVNGSLHTEEWREWAQAHGVETPSLDGALVLDGTEQIMQAAAEGLGIGIGRRPMVDGWLADGRLDAPFGNADESGCAYYLVYPQDVGEISVPARRVARWLVGLCKGEEAAEQLFAQPSARSPDEAAA